MNSNATYLNGQYLEDNPTWHIEDSAWKAQQILKMMHKHDFPRERIAEVGCGAGEILSQLYEALPETTQFFGYEISPQAYRLAQERQKPRLRYELKDLTSQEVWYDTLLVIDVFEHVADYLGFLKSLSARAQWAIFHIPLDLSVQTVFRDVPLLHARQEVGHLHYFTEGTAIATLLDCGYRIEDYFFTARSLEGTGGGLKRKVANVPRQLISMVSPSLASKILGGYSLLVLARSNHDSTDASSSTSTRKISVVA